MVVWRAELTAAQKAEHSAASLADHWAGWTVENSVVLMAAKSDVTKVALKVAWTAGRWAAG